MIRWWSVEFVPEGGGQSLTAWASSLHYALRHTCRLDFAELRHIAKIPLTHSVLTSDSRRMLNPPRAIVPCQNTAFIP